MFNIYIKRNNIHNYNFIVSVCRCVYDKVCVYIMSIAPVWFEVLSSYVCNYTPV